VIPISTISPKNSTVLSVGERVLLLRKNKGVSQLELAEIIRARQEKIVSVEKGNDEYTEVQLNAIREHFNIAGMPITGRECVAFRERLYLWRDLIRNRSTDIVKEMHREMANISNIEPYAHDLIMLYKMIEIQLYLVNNDIATAEKLFNAIANSLDDMNDECMYHYYNIKGYLSCINERHEEGLMFYLKALEIKELYGNAIPADDARLPYNISTCYTLFDIPYKAISYAQMACEMHIEARVVNFDLHINHMMALNYIKVNQLQEAEKLLDKILLKAESIKDDFHISRILFGYGLMHKKTENVPLAIEYFDKALKYAHDNRDNYNSACYQKIHCIIQTRAFSKAEQALEQAKKKCGQDVVWTTYFEALSCYLSISRRMTTPNDKASEYIETVAIPHFHKSYDYILSLDYYELLEQHYEKSRRAKKVLPMTKAILSIYKRCFAHQERR